MNIYLISQNENSGYDTYDAAVVAAESEDEARQIHPSYPNAWLHKSETWATVPENVSVRLIGVAVDGTEAGEILASFNAG